MSAPLTKTRATFAAWMRATNAEVQRRCGLDVLDLPDIDFRSLYEDHETPATAAQYVIDNADDDLCDGDED